MSISGNCIKTGAVVCFIEYGQTFVADLFKVGDAIIIHTAPDVFDKPMAFDHPRPVTHDVYIGSAGLIDKRAGFFVALAANVKEVAS